MEEFEIRRRLEEIPKEIEEKENEWIKENETLEIMENNQKIILASIKNEKEGSEAARERLAFTDPRYENHMKGMALQKKITLKLKAAQKKLEKDYEVLRSFLSIERAKIGIR
jgi:hypothetical protein